MTLGMKQLEELNMALEGKLEQIGRERMEKDLDVRCNFCSNDAEHKLQYTSIDKYNDDWICLYCTNCYIERIILMGKELDDIRESERIQELSHDA